MLQIQPDKDIVIEFIKNEDFKYYYIYLTQNIVTVLIPAILLLFFNAIIIWKLLQNRKEFNT